MNTSKYWKLLILSAVDLTILVLCLAVTRIGGWLPVSVSTLNRFCAAISLPVVYIAVFSFFRINNTVWRYSTYADYARLSASVLIVCIFTSIAYYATTGSRRSIVGGAIFTLLSLVGTVASRVVYRMLTDFLLQYREGSGSVRRLLIVGAGYSGYTLLEEIRSHPAFGLTPVGFIDDDHAKIGRNVGGVRVCGSLADVEQVCRDLRVELIYVAIPSAGNTVRAQILDACAKTGCEVKMLPYMSEINKGSTDMIGKIRDITPEELLGREPVELCNKKIYGAYSGRTVVVTGGGGSIGSELCRQIAAHDPKKLIIIDIYENNAFMIEQELTRKYGAGFPVQVYIASVRDYDRLRSLFEREKPDIVLHAAAHKHVPLMEDSPEEAVKNNIFGTYNAARAAMESGVSRFVLISTDKAVNPTNFMGCSKRICELVVQYFSHLSASTTYMAVRFGNVLGSNGSVIPIFKKQLEAKQDLTVTHPDIIRYFMTIPEASQLVLTAGAIAKGGELFILDMGSPVKIDDLAKKMILLSGLRLGTDIRIRYTGLRPGEKLYEELLMAEEGLTSTENEKIFVGRLAELDYGRFLKQLDGLRELVRTNPVDTAELEERFMEIVPSFRRYVPGREKDPARSDLTPEPKGGAAVLCS